MDEESTYYSSLRAKVWTPGTYTKSQAGMAWHAACNPRTQKAEVRESSEQSDQLDQRPSSVNRLRRCLTSDLHTPTHVLVHPTNIHTHRDTSLPHTNT